MNTSGIDCAKVEAEIMSDVHIKDAAKELALMPYFQIKDKELSEAQVIEYVFMAGAKSEAARQYWQMDMYSEDELSRIIHFTIRQHSSIGEQQRMDHEQLVSNWMDVDLLEFIKRNKKK